MRLSPPIRRLLTARTRTTSAVRSGGPLQVRDSCQLGRAGPPSIGAIPRAASSIPAPSPRELSFRAWLRQLTAAPLHDFPLRDALLFQMSSLPALLAAGADLDCRPRVFEAGPGCGFTAHTLAGQAELILAEVSPATARRLCAQFAERRRVRVLCADLAKAGLDLPAQGCDFAFALDMFEYVSDPDQCLRNFAAVLAPGGELFLTFPNVPPPRGDAVCWFESASAIEALVAAAGFTRWHIHTVTMRPAARYIYAAGHEAPLRACRLLRGGNRRCRPRHYEGTWAFQNHARLERHKLPLHLWWSVLDCLLRMGGPIFSAGPADGALIGRRVLIRAWKAS